MLYLFHTIKSDSQLTVIYQWAQQKLYIYTHSVTHNKYFVILYILLSIKMYLQINKETATYGIHGFNGGTVALKTFFPLVLICHLHPFSFPFPPVVSAPSG